MTRSCRLSVLRAGSSSVSRSSSAGCSVSRTSASTISRGLRGPELDAPDAQQRVLALIRRQHALATAVEDIGRLLLPLGLAPEANLPVGARFGAGIASGKQGRRLPRVHEAHVGGAPQEIAQIGGRLDRDRADALEGHPVVAAVDDGLADGSEP